MFIRNRKTLSDDFKAYEFQCKGETNPGFICCGGSMFISLLLIEKVQKLRELVGVPLKINSGCRCLTYNRSGYLNSKDTSSHTLGLACDIAIPNGMGTEEFYEIVVQSGLFMGKGIYNTFVHVDVDSNKGGRQWDNRTQA